MKETKNNNKPNLQLRISFSIVILLLFYLVSLVSLTGRNPVGDTLVYLLFITILTIPALILTKKIPKRILIFIFSFIAIIVLHSIGILKIPGEGSGILAYMIFGILISLLMIIIGGLILTKLENKGDTRKILLIIYLIIIITLIISIIPTYIGIQLHLSERRYDLIANNIREYTYNKECISLNELERWCNGISKTTSAASCWGVYDNKKRTEEAEARGIKIPNSQEGPCNLKKSRIKFFNI